MIALSKTPNLTQEEMSKRCSSRSFYINANNEVFGRLASVVAFLLQNKIDPSNSDNHTSSSDVTIYNLSSIILTGKKEDSVWSFPSKYAVKSVKFDRGEKILHKIFRHAVLGMLPKNRLRKRMITHLFLKHGSLSDDLTNCSLMNILGTQVNIRGSIL